uniref:CREB/ATF bZIP transcription factor n=1 Tax=Culex pipiens TaxID=7175 RepID=A0A8D8HZ77_CULPI
MASSLDRIFAKSAYFKDDDDEDTCSGSETETVPEDASVESDEEYEPAVKRRRSGGVAPAVPELKVERNPTRRPNPKVVNRNAVMARENRLRKKQHVENLEREIARLKEQRERDQKALRKAGKQVRVLTRERDHLKAVVANKSGIMAVLRAVRDGAGLPMTSSLSKYGMGAKAGSSCDEGFGASPNPASEHNNNDLGLSVGDGLFGGAADLLPADELLSGMGGACDADQQVITTEHNYFEHSNHTSLDSGSEQAGVCVHIVPGGRVSVEFCHSCAVSSQLAWLEEEQER